MGPHFYETCQKTN